MLPVEVRISVCFCGSLQDNRTRIQFLFNLCNNFVLRFFCNMFFYIIVAFLSVRCDKLADTSRQHRQATRSTGEQKTTSFSFKQHNSHMISTLNSFKITPHMQTTLCWLEN